MSTEPSDRRAWQLLGGSVLVVALLTVKLQVAIVVMVLVVLLRLLYAGYRREHRRYAQRTAGDPSRTPTGSTLIGTNRLGLPVYVADTQLAAHGLVLGATGSGKSTSLLALVCDQIVRGAPVVVVDLKGSLQFGNQLSAACQQAGRPFQFWRPEGPAHWNPLAYGDATELKDKLISAEKFTEPHYQRAAERYLQTAIQVLQAASPDRPVTLAAVVGMLDRNFLKAMLAHVPKPLASRVGPYITGMTRDQESAVSGLQSRLALLSESAVGEYLQPGEHQIDLRRALTGGNEVVLFSLNSSRYGKLSAQLASMVIQDLIAVSGHRLTQPVRPLAIVAIDEFSALDADNLLNLQARAREAGISVLLSTQELADLERVAAGFKDQILGNIAVLLAHRQNVPDSAELIAKMVGTRTVWQETHQTQKHPLLGKRYTGLGSRRQVEEFQIHPNLIKNLQTGQAVLLTKTPRATATPINVRAWRPEESAR